MVLGWMLSWTSSKALNFVLDELKNSTLNDKLRKSIYKWGENVSPKLDFPDQMFAWENINGEIKARRSLSAKLFEKEIPDIKCWKEALIESFLSVRSRLGDNCHNYFKKTLIEVDSELENLAHILYGICINEDDFFKKSVIKYNDILLSRTEKLLVNTDETRNDVNEIKQILNQLLQAGSFPSNQKSFDDLIKDRLGSDYYWVDPQRIRSFDEALKKQNELISNKRTKFQFNQTVISSMFKISHLEELNTEWHKKGRSPEKLDHISFIQKGVMAYHCLKQIPHEIVNDLRTLNWSPIHHSFYSGYLGTFVNELKLATELKWDLIERYKNDTYLFENINRIFTSLKLFLEFDASDIYPELDKAKLLREIPNEIVVVSSSKELTIRNTNDLDIIIAKLPLNSLYTVPKIEIIHYDNEMIVVGFTAQEGFYWNPHKDIKSTAFFKISEKKSISNLFAEVDSYGNAIIYLKVGINLLKFINFKQTDEQKLIPRISIYKNGDRLIGVGEDYLNSKGPILYELSDGDEINSIITVEKLRRLVKEAEPIRNWLNGKEEIIDGLFDLQHIYGFDLKVTIQNIFFLRGVVDSTGVLIITKIENSEIEILNIIHLPKSSFIALDILEGGADSMVICCGYLDRKRDENVFELIRLKDFNVLASNTIKRKRINAYDVRDIHHVCFGDNTIFLNQNGTSLLKYKINEDSFEEYQFDSDNRINYLSYISLCFS